MMLPSRRVKRLLAARDVDALVDLLKGGKRRERRAAARALGRLGDPRAVEPLSVALRTAYGEDGDLPLLIVTALGELNESQAVEPLKRLLADRRDDQFYFLAHRQALFELADLGVFDPLAEVANDRTRDPSLRGEAEALLHRHSGTPPL